MTGGKINNNNKKQLFFLFKFFVDIQAVTLIFDTTHVQKITEQQLELNQQLQSNTDDYCGLDIHKLKTSFFGSIMWLLAFYKTDSLPFHFCLFSVREPCVHCVRWPS